MGDCDKLVDTMPASFQRIPKPKSKGKGTTATKPDIEPLSSHHTGSQHQGTQPPAYDNTHTSNEEVDDKGSDDHNRLPELPLGRTTTGGDDNPNHSSNSSSSDYESLASSNKASNRRREIIK